MVVGAFTALLFLARPAYHLLRTFLNDNHVLANLPDGHLDDASRLNLTETEKWDAPEDLAKLLAQAREEGRRVSIAGARHSMGGHTLYPGGIVINMLPWNRFELDESQRILNVQAGALWEDIIPFLDKRGLSVGVMQSNDSFSVGGSLSVNCHGWQYNRPPIASTVESFRIMLADGTIKTCSRTENKELFSLALGGYGLFGIILDAKLRVVPNERYRVEQRIVSTEHSMGTFKREIYGRPGLQMFYARMNVVPERLFDEVIINAFFTEEGDIPTLGSHRMVRLQRAIFRGSAENDYGKKLRYTAETNLQNFIIGAVFSRNQLLNESVRVFENRTHKTTDILHEYFVPIANTGTFVNAARATIQKHKPNLLNVTVRQINEDPDTFLRYADKDMIAFVMLFVQDKTPSAEEQMKALTRDLIDDALANGGRYYLPYRLHATKEQFNKAYPQAKTFFKWKRLFDPEQLFQNYFYLEYGG